MVGSADLRIVPASTRLFSLEEANGMLNAVETIFRSMDSRLARIREVRELLEDLEQYYGDDLSSAPDPERNRHQALWIETQGLTESVNEDVARIHGLGCVVKDVATGLVDFHGVVGGEIVFLCWKRGEPRIAYFHSLTSGYAGRKPLPPSV